MQSTNPRTLDELVVSLQADWACAWVRVDGLIDDGNVPLVLQAVRAACAERPRKLRLLLKGARYGQGVQHRLLSGIAAEARDHDVKLVTQTARAQQRAWYRTLVRRRRDASGNPPVPAVA